MNQMVRPPQGSTAPFRDPPRSPQAEQAVLGSILINNKAFEAVAAIVKADDFSEEMHRRTFEVAAQLIASGQAATPITLAPFLGDHDVGNGVTVPVYLAHLAADHSMPMLARDYAVTVHDLAVRRRIITAVEEVANQAYDLPASVKPAQMAGDAIASLHAIAGAEGARSSRRDAHVSAAAALNHILAVQQDGVKTTRVSTGLPDLDHATEGFQPGTLWVLAARPGMGKTAAAVSLANKVACGGFGAFLFSLEVPEEQITARLLADLSYSRRDRITFKQIMSGDVSAEGLWTLQDTMRRLEAMPLTLDVASRLTPAEIRMRVRAEKERMAAKGVTLRVVLIDYLKQVQASDRYKGNRVYEVGEITYSMKQLAKDEGVCVVLLAQLNRQLEGRDDKRPGLSDLRESGDLETDADVVAFVHREAYFIQRSAEYRNNEGAAHARFDEEEHRAELILGKNRIGPTTTIHLFCDIACSTMSSIAREP